MNDAITTTASTVQLQNLLNKYYTIFPKYTFPTIPFVIAAFFQSLAWASGPIFLANYSLIPRVMILLLFAAGEYLFMSPAMNAGVEILNMKEAHLVTEYHITTLIVFIFVNIYLFKKSFDIKYIFAFLFSGLAVYAANY